MRVARWIGLASCVLLVVTSALSAFHPVVFGVHDVGWVVMVKGAIVLGDRSIQGQLFFGSAEQPSLELWNTWSRTGPVIVPVYPLLLFAIFSTMLVWRVGRPYPTNHCRTCGYNLTGNVSGRCPECGEAVAR